MSGREAMRMLIAVVAIFASYFALHPMQRAPALHSGDYRLIKTFNIASDNPSARFVDEGSGTLFVHPGAKKRSGGLFAFEKEGSLILRFSIRRGSKAGDILFTVLKNGTPLQTLRVTAQDQTPRTYLVPITKRDTIGIWADKNGSPAEDWGNLELAMKEPAFGWKNVAVPFLWSLLFLFLAGKRHTYIAINAYVGFYLMLLAEKLNFGAIPFETISTYMLLFFGLTFLFVFMYQKLAFLKRLKVATAVSYLVVTPVYVVPLFFIVYALNYHTPVTMEILFAVFQTNLQESIDYIADFISPGYIALFLTIMIGAGVLLYLQEKRETSHIENSLSIFLTVTFLSIVSAHYPTLRLPGFVAKGFDAYAFELERFKRTQALRKTGKIKFEATKAQKGETYIVVIGESLNKAHMSLYTYGRETTPRLEKLYRDGALVRFDNVYSNHTHTVLVLDLALTEANQYNRKNFYDSLSIIDIAKKAGFETYWITNQPLYSLYDNMVSVIGTSADHVVALNNDIGGVRVGAPSYDGAVVEKVEAAIKEHPGKNKLIFVHLGGSHTTYADRYPKARFSRFVAPPKAGVVGTKASNVPTLNSYDNSVYYNDYVVSEIWHRLRRSQEAAAFVYLSDHADDVVDRLAHNSSMFTFSMTQIPMIMWFSSRYKTRYPQKYRALLSHRNTLFSNDMLYDTLVGLTGIRTDRYDARYDLSTKRYRLDPEHALVLHGKKHYNDPKNHYFWQRYNAEILQKDADAVRVLPDAVETVTEAKEVLADGYEGFVTTVRYRRDADTISTFLPKKGEGVSLDRLLKTVDAYPYKRIVLKFVASNTGDEEAIVTRLEALDRIFSFRKKTIVETNLLSLAKKAKERGWRVAFCPDISIPVNGIGEKQAQERAKKLAAFFLNNGIEESTFDLRLSDWVETYLKPLLPQTHRYHFIGADMLYDPALLRHLQRRSVYRSHTAATVRYAYDSPFSL